jgi:hypothetical protein
MAFTWEFWGCTEINEGIVANAKMFARKVKRRTPWSTPFESVANLVVHLEFADLDYGAGTCGRGGTRPHLRNRFAGSYED